MNTATNADRSTSDDDPAALGGGTIAGVAVAAVALLAMGAFAVHKLVLAPAAAAKAVSAKPGVATDAGALSTIVNPMSRAGDNAV